MIGPQIFFENLINNGIEFFCGVPDSLLKSICAYITDHTEDNKHIITANEGGAIGLAAGYHLASGKIPLVYMQNSGIGNAVNPLLSLADSKVYAIPMLLMIGWRGEPGVKDEPQHIKQGAITLSLLETMQIPYVILSDKEADFIVQLREAVATATQNSTPFALVVKKDTFEPYKLDSKTTNPYPLSREEAIVAIAKRLEKNDIVVSTTGMISRELYEYRERTHAGHQADFLTVGSMGHAVQIALGIALEKKDRRVYCLDGDGAILMHMGSLAIVGSANVKNLIHLVLNNGAHDSVGGQSTVGFEVDCPQIAKSCGYAQVFSVTNEDELQKVWQQCRYIGPTFIEFKVRKGARPDLGRPKTSPKENKEAFVDFLKER
ncbi:MAG: Acetolactate synthase isozyme 1 large subunit [Bacteroidetes bacterium ADurb.Bin174]|jgi:phosphonopyruvate decarboxylase|nr:MAG: Acetolactate synthase isozyme 1 large subunit [Bacteroidetes bacterium ADurb.Bin174]